MGATASRAEAFSLRSSRFSAAVFGVQTLSTAAGAKTGVLDDLGWRTCLGGRGPEIWSAPS